MEQDSFLPSRLLCILSLLLFNALDQNVYECMCVVCVSNGDEQKGGYGSIYIG